MTRFHCDTPVHTCTVKTVAPRLGGGQKEKDGQMTKAFQKENRLNTGRQETIKMPEKKTGTKRQEWQ